MIPKLRFPGFDNSYHEFRIKEILERLSDPVDVINEVEYHEIGVKSHGKGIFHKEPVKGFDLGNKRVFWIHPKALVINIVFAWEQAVALTTEKEVGKIGSHRFPMYVPKNDKCSVEFVYYFFLTRKGKKLLGIASPGGAGRNKTLGQTEFNKLRIAIPDLSEQRKVGAFLSLIDRRIDLLEERFNLLGKYKKATLQRIFKQQIRFKKDDGNDFPDWLDKPLNNFLEVSNDKNMELKYSKNEVLSVSKKHGVINQIEHLGRSYAGESVHNYKVLRKGEIVYTKSPLKDNPYGIVKVNERDDGIVSTLYAVYKCKSNLRGKYLDYYFQLDDNLNRYLRPLVRKGAKNDMKINNLYVLNDHVKIPSVEEQDRIIGFLAELDKKIEKTSAVLKKSHQFKRGLLQQMFV